MKRVPIRIVLADDDPLILRTLSLALCGAPDLRVVAAVHDGDAAIRAARALGAHVVVFDLSMPFGQLAGVLRLRAAVPSVQVLVFTGLAVAGEAYRAFRAGARGYVVKSSDPGDVVRALRTVAAGRPFLDPELGGELIAAIDEGRGVAGATAASLSAREYEVLRAVAGGSTSRQVASALGLSVKTVEAYRARAKAKLELRTAEDVSRFALEAGWVRPE